MTDNRAKHHNYINSESLLEQDQSGVELTSTNKLRHVSPISIISSGVYGAIDKDYNI